MAFVSGVYTVDRGRSKVATRSFHKVRGVARKYGLRIKLIFSGQRSPARFRAEGPVLANVLTFEEKAVKIRCISKVESSALSDGMICRRIRPPPPVVFLFT